MNTQITSDFAILIKLAQTIDMGALLTKEDINNIFINWNNVLTKLNRKRKIKIKLYRLLYNLINDILDYYTGLALSDMKYKLSIEPYNIYVFLEKL
jgi:hypothetical protein